METIKKLRKNYSDNYTNAKKRKIQMTTTDTNCSSKEVITNFEDLSNELIYEIFDFLDFFHIYQTFFTLNKRFQDLFTSSQFPIKINISSMSKSTFQDYYTNIIIPYQDRINSLCITNFLSFELDSSPHRILFKFTRLETLILENINSNYLENVLKDIALLPSLSSLSLFAVNFKQNIIDIFRQIFRLPVLKYFKISFPYVFKSGSLPFTHNDYSPIEHLVIDLPIQIDYLDCLLSYVPQLRRLWIYLDTQYDNKQKDVRISLNNLTHSHLKLYKILRISTTNNNYLDYFNANRWKQLILSYIPQLRIFDIQHVYYHLDRIMFDSLISEFNSSFWFERQWFFVCQHEIDSEFSGYSGIFYSTNPYRYEKIILFNKHIYLSLFKEKVLQIKYEMNKGAYDFCTENINLNSVRHVTIFDNQAINNCVKRFPNATDLTLSDNSNAGLDSSIIALNRIISLQKLTNLVINCTEISLEKLIELLLLTRNINTLNIKSISFKRKEFASIQSSDTFRLVSSTNNIRNLTIENKCTLEQVQLLFMLFPRLQYFTTTQYWGHFADIIRLLLSKTNDSTSHLFSLCITKADEKVVQKLKKLIQSEKLLDDYFVKFDDPRLYLWW